MDTQDTIRAIVLNLKKANSEIIFAENKSNRFKNWSQMILLTDTLNGIIKIIDAFINEFDEEE